MTEALHFAWLTTSIERRAANKVEIAFPCLSTVFCSRETLKRLIYTGRVTNYQAKSERTWAVQQHGKHN